MTEFLAGVPVRFVITGSEIGYGIALMIVLLWLNALFHAAESALSGLRNSRIKELGENKDPKAKRLRYLSDHIQSFFATCQVGFQVARVGVVTIAVLTAPILASWMGGADFAAFWLALSILILVFLAALVNLALIELLFRAIARKNPDAWANGLYGFLMAARLVLSPLVWLVSGLSSVFARRFGVRPLFSPPIVTEEDLREMVEATGASGELIEDEKEMIHSIIEFTDTVAREVMTPRTDVDALPSTANAADAARLIEETGHTRIPIYEDTIDKIVGIVHAKDLLKSLLDGNGTDLSSIMRPAHFIPESKDLHQLLTEFRSGRTQMAIVQDEFGGTAGLVTIEDVVEEIVGEIVDEYDVEEPEAQEVGPGEWLLDGKMHLDDVNDEIGSHFTSEEFDTLGGFVFGLCGRQPSNGDVVEQDDWELAVAETDGRRVIRVRATRRIEQEESLA